MPFFNLSTSYSAKIKLHKASETPILMDDECHIWMASEERNFSALLHYADILSLPELNKAHRFAKPKDQELYKSAHTLLRLVLAGYTGVKPSDLIISDVYGKKPTLGFGMPSLEFNLSHAEGYVVIAVSRYSQVGIDVEKIDQQLEWESIAAYYFSHAEQTALQKASPNLAKTLFYTFWTRKEAWLKAVGLGLINDLPLIDTSSTRPSFHLEDDRLTDFIDTSWNITSYCLNPDYLFSLACLGKISRYSFYQWK